MKVFGNLERAQIEAVASLPAALKGRIIYLTAADGDNPVGFYYCLEAAWRRVLDANHMDTSARDSLTPNEGEVIYNLDTKSLNIYDGVVWKDVGSSSGGGGGFSYTAANPSAETDVTGWIAYANTTPGVAPDDFGGTPNVDFTLARNISDPLTDVADFLLTKTANNRQGHGYYWESVIQNADLAQIIRVAMNYKASANYADGYVRVYFVTSDDEFATNNVIELTQRDVNATSLAKLYLSEGQFLSTDTKVRICIHVATDTTTAWTFNFARVSVGPREIARGVVETDPIAYTPVISISTNITGVSGKWSKKGKWMKCQVVIDVAGASDAVAITVALPAGYAMDPEGLAGDLTTEQLPLLGTARIVDGGGYHIGAVRYHSATTVLIMGDDGLGAWTGASAGSVTVGAGDDIVLDFEVPILGWSSNQTMSSDFGGRVITVYGASNGGGSVTADVTNIDWTEVSDSTSSWDGTTFTAPETGDYAVSGSVEVTSATGLSIQAYINGTVHKTVGNLNLAIIPISGQIKLNKGQLLTFRSTATRTLSASATNHTISIHKIQSPQTLAGGEIVAARYTTAAGQSIANAATPIVDFGTKVFDTHNAVTTGASWKFTAPYSGKYRITSSLRYANGLAWVAGGGVASLIYKVGSTYASADTMLAAAGTFGSSSPSSNITSTVDMSAGEYIDIRTLHSESSARALLTSGNYNFVEITKVN
jgi:hypothetical protein